MTQTINPVKNPSAETNTTGYYPFTATGVATPSNPTTGGAPGAGTDFYRLTWTAASTAAGSGAAIGHSTNAGVERIDVVASTQYTAGVWVRASKAKTLQLQAIAYTAAGAVANSISGTATAVAANAWVRIKVTITTAATGVRLVLRVVDTDATLWSIGNTLDVDAVMVWPGDATALPAYSDPSTNGWMGWQGAAHQSPSILYTPQLVITPYLDANPSPRAEVFVQDPPPGTVNLTRFADGRTMPVRGAVDAPSGSGVSRIDTEVPFGVSVTYQAEIVRADGTSLGFVTATPVTLNVNECWASQPLNPRLAVRVDLTDDSLQEIPRGFDGDVVRTDGGTVGRWIGGRRKGVTDLKLTLETDTADDMDTLQDVFGTYQEDQVPVVCIRTPPGYARIPRVLFLAAPNPTEIPINVQYGGTLTQLALAGDEVLPPAPGLVVPLLRYGDTDAFYGSYAAIDAAYGSYLARDRDYSKAGYAG